MTVPPGRACESRSISQASLSLPPDEKRKRRGGGGGRRQAGRGSEPTAFSRKKKEEKGEKRNHRCVHEVTTVCSTYSSGKRFGPRHTGLRPYRHWGKKKKGKRKWRGGPVRQPPKSDCVSREDVSWARKKNERVGSGSHMEKKKGNGERSAGQRSRRETGTGWSSWTRREKEKKEEEKRDRTPDG